MLPPGPSVYTPGGLGGPVWGDEVAAFEELVGSHGGVGASQSYPFVLYPGGWTNTGERK